jgi:hypothetical protein
LDSDLLPISLSNLSALNIEVSWSITASADAGEDLAAIDATADVVVDMFLDLNPVRANSTTLPQYEVMVWMATFGGKTPIGFNSSIGKPPSYSVGGTELYASANLITILQKTDCCIANSTPAPTATASLSTLGWLHPTSVDSAVISPHCLSIYGDIN